MKNLVEHFLEVNTLVLRWEDQLVGCKWKSHCQSPSYNPPKSLTNNVQLKKNVRHFLPSNYMNKNIRFVWCNWGQNHLLTGISCNGWCQTPHMPTSWTLITNQHGGRPYDLPTQHTMESSMNNYQIKVHMIIHMKKTRQQTITHMILPNPTTIKLWKVGPFTYVE
jgi:hypothetical protein